MRILLVSGLSGSGKSVALDTLEDHGFHCVDNMPPPLLPDYVRAQTQLGTEQAAIGIDARARAEDLQRLPDLLEEIRAQACATTVIFLDAGTDTLIRRYSDTRRRHPLADQAPTLREAVERERRSLSGLADLAELRIDTSATNVHELRTLLHERIGLDRRPVSILLQSFAYRRGVPSDSDFVFDCRCLPNPHWEPALRARDGTDPAVDDYLSAQDSAQRMRADLERFLGDWIPAFVDANRHFLNVSVGCTGGQHRSVYLVEKLAAHIARDARVALTVRHRDLMGARA